MREGVKGPTTSCSTRPSSAATGRAAIDWWYPSTDGALVAYGFSTEGTELSTLHVRDVKTGADLPDAIPYTRYATVAWVPDDKGFYYVRLPEPGTVPAGEELQHRKIFFHRLGNDWHKDKVVFEPAAKEDSPAVLLSPGGRWLVAAIDKGCAGERRLRARPLEGGRRTVGPRRRPAYRPGRFRRRARSASTS